MAEIAATSSEKIKPEEVHRYFEGMELSEEQEKMVYEYLNLPPEAVIHRLTGDGAKRDLLAPLWSGDKKRVLNAIHQAFLRDNLIQGSTL